MPCVIEIKHVGKVEKLIMKWAAEHPVYPTWGEWLEWQGIVYPVYHENNAYEPFKAQSINTTPKYNEPIPDDIAERLGIPPVEVTK